MGTSKHESGQIIGEIITEQTNKQKHEHGPEHGLVLVPVPTIILFPIILLMKFLLDKSLIFVQCGKQTNV